MRDHPGDYYSDFSGPRSEPLRRPVVLAGVPGVGLTAIATAIGSLSGWPVVEVDRRVEHDAGRSVGHLVVSEGRAMVAARARAHLARALAQSPPAVVAVRASVLQTQDARSQVLDAARLFYVERPVDVLVAGLRELRSRSPGSVPDFVGARMISPAEVVALVERAHVVRASAEQVFFSDVRSSLRMARDIIRALEV